VMKALFVVLLVLAAVSAEDSDLKKWHQFKLKFDKVYPPSAETERFAIFKENLKLIDMRNAGLKHKVHGLTKFMDLSVQEFKSTILMNTTRLNFRDYSRGKVHQFNVHNYNASVKFPASFDWGDKGMLTPVKNQGQCGSCWDFSATETYESVCAISTSDGLQGFSEQQTVDCDTSGSDEGCNGGLPEGAYAYLISNGGIETEGDYPYTAEDGTCNENSSELAACKITDWKWITQSSNENDMQTYLYSSSGSPLSICVDASSWSSYTGGVMTAENCGTDIDHCVQLTGWTQYDNGDGTTTPAWSVRNSWGKSSWGDPSKPGYIFLEMGTDCCAMADHVTVPIVG